MRVLILISLAFLIIGCGSKPDPVAEDAITSTVQPIDVAEEDIEEPNETIDTIGLNGYWSNVDISSAILYDYAPEFRDVATQSVYILNEKNELNPTVLDSFTLDLNSASLNQLKKNLINETTYESWGADCFEPHHGIVMKDKSGNMVGHISICFQCGNYSIRPEHVDYINIDTFRTIVMRHKITTSGQKIRSTYGKLYNNK